MYPLYIKDSNALFKICAWNPNCFPNGLIKNRDFIEVLILILEKSIVSILLSMVMQQVQAFSVSFEVKIVPG